MRKIIASFDSIAKVQKLKKIMKLVYAGNNDNIPDVAKFYLGKTLTPERVERVELEIKRIIGSNITITVPKPALTFLAGGHPFARVLGNYEQEDRFIVLPWNIATSTGRENLKHLIEQIPTSATAIKYTIYVNDETGSVSDSEAGSFAEFSLSRQSFADDTEQLLQQIELLEARLREVDRVLNEAKAEIDRQKASVNQKEAEVSGLKTQVATATTQNTKFSGQVASLSGQVSSLTSQNSSLNSQISSLNGQLATMRSQATTSQPWTIILPNTINGNVTVPQLNIGTPLTGAGIRGHANIDNVAGNIALDITNRTLTIGGHSCGTINAA